MTPSCFISRALLKTMGFSFALSRCPLICSMVVRMSSEKAHLAFLLSSTLVYTALKKKIKLLPKKFPSKSWVFLSLTRTLCHIYFRNIFRLYHFVYKSALIFWPLVYSCPLPFCSSLKWKKRKQGDWLQTVLWQLAGLGRCGVSSQSMTVRRARKEGGRHRWRFVRIFRSPGLRQTLDGVDFT